MAELQFRMSEPEFLDWVQYHNESPIDDYSRIYRPAALIAQCAGGGQIKDKFDFLLRTATSADGMSADQRTMQAFGFTKKGG